jgi:hypothetical protein
LHRCRICGKDFSTLDALQQHHRTVHPKQKYAGPKKDRSRQLKVSIIIVLILAGGGVGYLIYLQASQPNTLSLYLGKPISSDFYSNLTGVSDTTLNLIANSTHVALPKSISGPPLNQSGLPEVLYIGGEYCPYCAAERWSLAIALSKFGNFSADNSSFIGYMVSATGDQNLSTITFRNASFTSQYVSFVAVEAWDRNAQPFQTISPSEQLLFSQYNPTQVIPFIDIDNQYMINFAQPDTALLQHLSWEQIYSQLNNPSSPVAQSIDGAAATIISAICNVDGGKPQSVCSQPYAHISLSSYDPAEPVITFNSGLSTGPVSRTEKNLV